MATSSIFANFNINNSEKAEKFVKALNESANAQTKNKVSRKLHSEDFLVRPEDIRNFLMQGKKQ